MNKKIQIFIVIVGVAFIGIVYALTKQPQIVPTTNAPLPQNEQVSAPVQLVPGSQVAYRGVDGKNALEVLKATHVVETKDYGDLGAFVTSIDGVEPDSKHFWAFYVDGQLAQVSASTYVTKNSEVIEWKLEEIK